MQIYLGSDHNGFELKNRLFAYLARNNYQAEDVGGIEYDPEDDYPQFAQALVTQVLGSEDEDPRGILICGSGQGMAIAANRFAGIRASVVWDAHEAKTTREDNDSNVLVLPAWRLESDKEIFGIVETWLNTDFTQAPRHIRRLKEIDEFYPN